MDKQLFDELRDLFDQRYKLRDDCNKEMDDVRDKLAKDATQFAVINTKLNAIIWGIGVIGAAVIGFLVKWVFGG